MSDGTIRNEEYLRKAKLYSMAHMAQVCRGAISPSDIDGLFYVHCRARGGRICIIEYKTIGKPIEAAQQESFEWMLSNLPAGCIGIIAEHEDLNGVIDGDTDVTRFCVYAHVGDRVRYSFWIDGSYRNLLKKWSENALYVEGELLPWLVANGGGRP